MEANLHTLDRIFRVIFAIVVVVLYFAGVINGGLAIGLGIVAVAFIFTSVISWCPIYAALGISTKGKKTS